MFLIEAILEHRWGPLCALVLAVSAMAVPWRWVKVTLLAAACVVLVAPYLSRVLHRADRSDSSHRRRPRQVDARR